jgi:4-amino-4-deoxy-L-arabinose transferase-like glycosyltransferase
VQPTSGFRPATTERLWSWALVFFCCLVVFQNLGAAHLFEPDEGRNAERARELLLLDNWAIPHENFLPALDKPIFFYWLIAIAYKLFGISEWSARLPSALAALGCLFLVYRFVRDRWGDWQARWSVLILLTNIVFFLYSRIVIFDVTLTFFTTLALIEFYRALETDDQGSRRRHVILMAIAMGSATLVKGPIGAALPGLIIFFHVLLLRGWSFLSLRVLLTAAIVFCAIVVPWAWWTETRYAGYLRYFIWEENFLRFFTPHFQRTEPWYYFLVVIACGFFPWSLFLPFVLKDKWKKPLAKIDIFLILWIAVPLLVFSASKSKLPHYILPIFPALSILTAQIIQAISEDRASKRRWSLAVPWLVWMLVIGYFVIGTQWPSLLHKEIRETITQLSMFQRSVNIFLLLVLAGLAFCAGRNLWREQRIVYLCHCFGMALLLWFVGQTFAAASHTRSAKTLAQQASPFIGPQSQLASYDSYMNGLPFYLRVERPIWVVWSGQNKIVMQNIYVAQKQPPPAQGFGQVLFTFEEFAKEWPGAKPPLLVFVRQQRLNLLRNHLGDTTQVLISVGNYSLVTKR